MDPRITFPSLDQARFHRVRACLNKLALTALFLEIPFKCLWSCVVNVGFETKTISAIKQIQTIQQNRLFVVAFHIDQWEIFFFLSGTPIVRTTLFFSAFQNNYKHVSYDRFFSATSLVKSVLTDLLGHLRVAE